MAKRSPKVLVANALANLTQTVKSLEEAERLYDAEAKSKRVTANRLLGEAQFAEEQADDAGTVASKIRALITP